MNNLPPTDDTAPCKVYTLPCHDIVVKVSPSGRGEITSSLLDGEPVYEDDGDAEYDTAMDAIESLILAHACAGVDVAAPAYVKGVEVAVENLTNKLL